MCLLIVDDDADVREAMKNALEAKGYETACAANGREALDYLRANEAQPCLVLLDVMMPVMDGWHLLEINARDRTLRGIPIVVMSAHIRDRRAGDTPQPREAFLEKPIPLERLLAVVGEHCPCTADSK